MKRAYESKFMITHLSKRSEQNFNLDGGVLKLQEFMNRVDG